MADAKSTLTSTSLKVISEASRLKGKEVFPIQKTALDSLIMSISDKQEQVEPFNLLDLGVVIRLMEKWNQTFPKIKPFYAVKCNTEPPLLVALAELGINFDCGSQAEIESILSLGVNPDRIIYSNTCKSVPHIKYAAKVGVNLTTFDSMEEVDAIKKWHPKCDLLLKLKIPDNDASCRPFCLKSGALPEEVVPLLQHANQAGLRVLGVSFHTGRIETNPQVYYRTIAAARSAFDSAIKLRMPPMHILNIGGGFKTKSFDEMSKVVYDSIQESFEDITSSITVIAEPGRYFAETAFITVTNVIGKRVRGQHIDYWIDDGIYGSFNTAANDHSSMVYKALLRNEDGAGKVVSSTIYGPTVDPIDVVVGNCELPELQVNDLIVFYNMGSYTQVFASKFNGFDRTDMPTYLAFTTAG